jgi:hypothetical protein
MKLTDEQRAGIARFLGFKEVAIVSKRFAPCHPYLIDADGTLEGERQWNDADLMLALLERAARTGHFVELLGPCGGDEENDPTDWEATVMDRGGEQVLGYGHSKQPAHAVILAVLRLKAAQP